MWMLLHGFTGAPTSWDAVGARLKDGQSTMRPLLHGHGRDWRARMVKTFGGEVDRLLQLAETMPRPRCLVGYSMGARLALAMHASRKLEFDAVVLIGVHPGLDDPAARASRRALDAAHAADLRERGLPSFVDAWEGQPLFDSQRRLTAESRSMQRQIRLDHDADGLASSLDVLGLAQMPSYRAAIAELHPPPTLVAGRLDLKFASLARELTTRPVLVEDAGHNVVLEAPDAVAALLREAHPRTG
ncbi:MAG: alpha/beta fold hydrolase [Myxococcota bacterium]